MYSFHVVFRCLTPPNKQFCIDSRIKPHLKGVEKCFASQFGYFQTAIFYFDCMRNFLGEVEKQYRSMRRADWLKNMISGSILETLIKKEPKGGIMHPWALTWAYVKVFLQEQGQHYPKNIQFIATNVLLDLLCCLPF